MSPAPIDERLLQRLDMAARQEVGRALKALPAELRGKARAIPVTVEPWPGKHLLRDGVESDTMGLFVEPDFQEGGMEASVMPSQILLFVMNIWEEARHDTETYRIEVRRTRRYAHRGCNPFIGFKGVRHAPELPQE